MNSTNKFATDSSLFQHRFQQLKLLEAWPKFHEYPPQLARLSEAFRNKSMCPAEFFAAAIAVSTSYVLGGSKIQITPAKTINTTIWIIISAISSSRKGEAHGVINQILTSLKPLYQQTISSDWQFTIDNATIEAVCKLLEICRGSMIIEHEEIREFEKVYKLEDKDGLKAKLIGLFDGNPWTFQYKTLNKIEIDNPVTPLFVGGQHDAVTDFLNRNQLIGIGPRILPIYTPGIQLLSTKLIKQNAAKWIDNQYDEFLGAIFQNLACKYHLPFLIEGKQYIHEFADEEAEEYDNQISDFLTGKFAEYEHTNSTVASAYGKAHATMVKLAVIYQAFETEANNVENNLILDQPLCTMTEEQRTALPAALSSQKILITKEALCSGYKTVEKFILIDLGLRWDFFPSLKKEAKSMQNIKTSWIGNYCTKSKSFVISKRYKAYEGLRINHKSATLSKLESLQDMFKIFNFLAL